MHLIKRMEQFCYININSAWKALPMAAFFKQKLFPRLFSFQFFPPAPLNENLMVAMAPVLMEEKR